MANRPTAKVAVLVFVALALTLAFSGAAFAHNQDSASLDCATVSGAFSQFGAADHPIVWHVAVDGGGFQSVPTTESPPGFVGAGSATAGISSRTATIGAGGGTVQAFAQWPGGQSATTTAHLGPCNPPPTTPTTTPTPPTTGGAPPPAPPPIAVVVHPAPVVFAPIPLAPVPTPVVVTPSTTG